MANEFDWDEIKKAQTGDTSKDKPLGKPIKEHVPSFKVKVYKKKRFNTPRKAASRIKVSIIDKRSKKKEKKKEGEINGR